MILLVHIISLYIYYVQQVVWYLYMMLITVGTCTLSHMQSVVC